MSNMKVFYLAVFFAVLFVNVPLLADDIEGSKDHSMISRFQGSSIIFYDTKDSGMIANKLIIIYEIY